MNRSTNTHLVLCPAPKSRTSWGRRVLSYGPTEQFMAYQLDIRLLSQALASHQMVERLLGIGKFDQRASKS